jgi:hypothetical protein
MDIHLLINSEIPHQHFTSLKIDPVTNKNFPPIYCISPILGKAARYHNDIQVWLDTNILSRADDPTKSPVVQELINWANTNKYSLNPILAMLEKFRSDLPVERIEKMIVDSMTKLRDVYGAETDLESVIRSLPIYRDAVRSAETDYVQYVAPLLALIKSIFHQTSMNFEERCEKLAKMMSEKYMISHAIFLLGCLYFFVQSKPDKFSSTIRDKIKNDMQIRTTYEKNRRDLLNFSGDFSLFTATSAKPLNPEYGIVTIPVIATADAGLAFSLRQLSYIGFTVDSTGVGNGRPLYRPGSLADKGIGKITSDLMTQYFRPHASSEWKERLLATQTISEKLLRTNFTADL